MNFTQLSTFLFQANEVVNMFSKKHQNYIKTSFLLFAADIWLSGH